MPEGVFWRRKFEKFYRKYGNRKERRQAVNNISSVQNIKKGETICDNYRAIALLDVYKLMALTNKI